MDEKTVIRQIKSGDKELFALLLRKYERIVNSILYSMVFDIETTKDLTQETFIKAYENLNSYNEEHEFKPWLARIARNHAIDYLRRRRQTISIEELETELPDGKESAGASAETAKGMVERAMARMKEEERTILLLKYKEGFSNREIAESLEMPENRVNVRIFRAKERMREILERENEKR